MGILQKMIKTGISIEEDTREVYATNNVSTADKLDNQPIKSRLRKRKGTSYAQITSRKKDCYKKVLKMRGLKNKITGELFQANQRRERLKKEAEKNEKYKRYNMEQFYVHANRH